MQKTGFLIKKLKINILTRVWSAQHPNARQNMQQVSKAWFSNC